MQRLCRSGSLFVCCNAVMRMHISVFFVGWLLLVEFALTVQSVKFRLAWTPTECKKNNAQNAFNWKCSHIIEVTGIYFLTSLVRYRWLAEMVDRMERERRHSACSSASRPCAWAVERQIGVHRNSWRPAINWTSWLGIFDMHLFEVSPTAWTKQMQ